MRDGFIKGDSCTVYPYWQGRGMSDIESEKRRQDEGRC